MKKAIIFFIVIGFFASCSNEKGWSGADRKKFVNDCTGEAAKGMDEAKARSYCECMQPKIETKYPTVAEANRMSSADLQTATWTAEVQSCLGMSKTDIDNQNTNTNNNTVVDDNTPPGMGSWTQSERDKFVQDCAGEAEKGMTRSRAESYCSCMQDKLEKIYPTFNQANMITDADLQTPSMQALVKGCLGTN